MTKKEFTNEQAEKYLIEAVITTETYRKAVEILLQNKVIFQKYGEKFIELSLDIEDQIKDKLEGHFEITENDIEEIKTTLLYEKNLEQYLDTINEQI